MTAKVAKSDKLLSIKEAEEYLGIGDFRIRMCLRSGRIKGTKVQEKHFEKWYIKQSDLDAYRASTGRNKDGRKAYLVRLNEAELKEVTAFLTERKIEIEPRYTPKEKQS